MPEKFTYRTVGGKTLGLPKIDPYRAGAVAAGEYINGRRADPVG